MRGSGIELPYGEPEGVAAPPYADAEQGVGEIRIEAPRLERADTQSNGLSEQRMTQPDDRATTVDRHVDEAGAFECFDGRPQPKALDHVEFDRFGEGDVFERSQLVGGEQADTVADELFEASRHDRPARPSPDPVIFVEPALAGQRRDQLAQEQHVALALREEAPPGGVLHAAAEQGVGERDGLGQAQRLQLDPLAVGVLPEPAYRIVHGLAGPDREQARDVVVASEQRDHLGRRRIEEVRVVDDQQRRAVYASAHLGHHPTCGGLRALVARRVPEPGARAQRDLTRRRRREYGLDGPTVSTGALDRFAHQSRLADAGRAADHHGHGAATALGIDQFELGITPDHTVETRRGHRGFVRIATAPGSVLRPASTGRNAITRTLGPQRRRSGRKVPGGRSRIGRVRGVSVSDDALDTKRRAAEDPARPGEHCNVPAGTWTPVVDHERCEAKRDCVAVCPNNVFEVRRIDDADFAALGLMAKLRVRAHRRQTAYTPHADACRACGLCVVACPELAITLVPPGG